ncbi:endonuclease/exonuclease/phosphatase family protein [Primorskyibacter flagellatus]|uniref:endonuclease/exonuclease/phosphatase family protein n=1 Tax=Primorskyibacter flagellatus TaxID=1387277 RepID=UPI00166D5038|nr:endonuclease/exonuclease/phosphatase family protein [Primorskyibacter flagellatus]
MAEILAGLSPDVAVLAGIDYDRGGAALTALAGAVERALAEHAGRPDPCDPSPFPPDTHFSRIDPPRRTGSAPPETGGPPAWRASLPRPSRIGQCPQRSPPAPTARALQASAAPPAFHTFTTLPNTGLQTGLDLDGDGRHGGPGDAQGYGRFSGQGGLAVISRWPVDLMVDHSARLWRDMPDTLLIDAEGREGAQASGADVQRLSSTAHWELRVTPPRGKPVTLMIFHATPPVFDGPEDRNGRRNHDEVIFWKHRLDGDFGPAPDPPYVIAGAANLDPSGGDGRGAAIRGLLSDPRLRDPPGLTGKATVDWPDPGPGRLRVDYLLPSADLILTGSGLAPDSPASRHRAIWIDIDLQAATAPPD